MPASNGSVRILIWQHTGSWSIGIRCRRFRDQDLSQTRARAKELQILSK